MASLSRWWRPPARLQDVEFSATSTTLFACQEWKLRRLHVRGNFRSLYFISDQANASVWRLFRRRGCVSTPVQRCDGGKIRAVQGMDHTAVCAACEELRAWIPAKIDRVLQVDKYTLVLGIRTVERAAWLHLSWHPLCAHFAIGSAPGFDTSFSALSFGDQLGVLLKNLAIVEVVAPGAWERVAQLRLGVRPTDAPTKDIYVEIMGRYSNVVLTDCNKEILACAYQVGARMTSVRTMQVGGKYQLPPAAPGTNPDTSSWLEWRSVIRASFQEKLVQGLVQSFRGVSPALAKELLCKAGLKLDTNLAGVTEEQWLSLHSAWQDWLTALKEGTFGPGLVRETGCYSVLGGSQPYMLSGVETGGKVADDVLEMLFDYYSRYYLEEKFQQLKHQLSAKVSSALKKVQAKVKTYSEQMESARCYSEFKKKGDLLMANLHLCQQGASSVEVLDFESGKPVSISLDPLQSATVAAQKFYKRSQKQKRSASVVAPLLEDAKTELSYLLQVELSLQQLELYQSAADLRAVEEVRDELIEESYLKPLSTVEVTKGKQKRRKKQSMLESVTDNLRKFASPSGFEVLVGRNNKQNDVLTNRIATDCDIWFHARNVAGCHLLLRVPPGKAPTDEDLQFAADTAAYYSKARGSGKVPVSYTSPKFLKKPKGMKPGLVQVDKETVMLGHATSQLLYT